VSEERIKQLAENSGKKYGGKLKNWSIHEIYDGVKFAMGVMSGQDPTNRWNEGDTVKTSSIEWIESDHDYVETHNTFYILEGERNPSPLPTGVASKVFF